MFLMVHTTAVLIKTYKTSATEKIMAQIVLKRQEETAELMVDTLAWSDPPPKEFLYIF
jgi:hypothetical protein